MIKAVFFDLDDTLLWDRKSVNEAFKATCNIAKDQYNINPEMLENYVRKHARALYATYDTYGFAMDIGINPFEAFWGEFLEEDMAFPRLREIVPAYRREAWTRGLEDTGIDDPDLGEKLADTFPKERRKNIFVYEDTFQVLDALKQDYQLLLLTNGSPHLQRTKLDLSPKLIPYFDHIVVSGAFGSGKPNPAIFKHALDLLSVNAEEAIMVGDNIMTDILGASRVGMKSVWINHHRVKRNKVNRTYEIRQLSGLLPILEKLRNKSR